MTPEPAWNALAAAVYDAVAEDYAATFYEELARKPFDRARLRTFAASLSGGRALDIGCGPGHVTRFLAARGLEVSGIDLSPQMVALAQRLNPSRRFALGDMRALEAPDGSVSGIVAFYSLIHLGRGEVTGALREFRRILCPGGRLLASFHVGDGVTHLDSWFEKPVALDVTFFRPDEMTGYAEAAGLIVDELQVRPPYDFEVQTERGYLLAHAP